MKWQCDNRDASELRPYVDMGFGKMDKRLTRSMPAKISDCVIFCLLEHA
jgi:hypothetical protein